MSSGWSEKIFEKRKWRRARGDQQEEIFKKRFWKWIQCDERKIFKETLKRKKLKDVNIETDDKFEILKGKDLQDVKQDTNNESIVTKSITV